MVTNGFDMAKVLPAFVGRIGWRQSTLPGSPVLDGDNKIVSTTYVTGQDKVYVVGDEGAPLDGSTQFADVSLDGYTYTLERRGLGTVVLGTEWDYLPGGGFALLLPGDRFYQGDVIILHITSAPGEVIPITPIESGRVYQDFHPMITLQRIKEAQENPKITDGQFNDLLRSMDNQVLLRCLNAVFNRPQLIDHSLVFERHYNLTTQPIANSGKFCGYQIRVAPGNFTAVLNTVSLYFDSAQTFNLYLFNDLGKTPLKTISVTTKATDLTTVSLNWSMSTDAQMGGIFYLGYFQDDLGTAKAIDIQYIRRTNMKVAGFAAFEAIKTGALDFQRYNPSVQYRSYGLNVEVSSYHDYSDVISKNAGLFDEARGLAMAIQVIDMIRNSSRVNGQERSASDQVSQLDLDMNLAFPTPDFPFVAGLKQQLIREFKRLSETFFPRPKAQSMNIGCRNGQEYMGFPLADLPPRQWA